MGVCANGLPVQERFSRVKAVKSTLAHTIANSTINGIPTVTYPELVVLLN